MQARVFTLVALLSLASTISHPLMAQFQTPTDEELKMTSDPKAPGAAAVYLNIEEVANDPLHYQSVYARIKVLTEKGKELATQEVPYLKGNFKITDIKARTIHSDYHPACRQAGRSLGFKKRRPANRAQGLYAAQRRGRQHSRIHIHDPLRRQPLLFTYVGDSARLFRA